MQKVLIMNAGSSSFKWQLFELPSEEVIAKGQIERLNLPNSIVTIKYNGEKYEDDSQSLNSESAIQTVLKKLVELHIVDSLDEISAVGHRVVAGGQYFTKAAEINDEVLAKIAEFNDFAPLHNPSEIEGIKIMQSELPNVRQFAVFDSTFFTDLPEMNAIYSLPLELTEKYGIHRYSEHGISHHYLANRAAQLLNKPLKDLRLITLHMGGGASAAAVKDGHAFDTSMGMAPLTGLTMGTRAGDVDPSIVPFLMKKENMSADDVLMMFNEKSGLLGLSGISSDMRDIEAALPDNKRAQLAMDIFKNRVVKYAASFYAEMGSADAIIFAGGIGENDPAVDVEIMNQLSFLGIKMKSADEIKRGEEQVMSTPDSKVTVMMIPTNEELSMLRQINAVM